MTNEFNIGQYLKKIHNIYSSKVNSIEDTLNSFRQITSEYEKHQNENIVQQFNYSSYNFVELSKEEQEQFINDQLQLVETLVINSIYDKSGVVWNWYDIFQLLYSQDYASVDKINRKVVYPTQSNSRPIGENSWALWNGLQIIDLDIKNEELSDKLKPLLFNDLKRYHWFLGICKSASKKSLHVWTKITPITYDNSNKKVEFLCNFRHKYSYIYINLLKYTETLGYNKEQIKDYMDMAMAKPQQGIFISSDNQALLNTNFQDLRLDVNFEEAFNNGIESINWISHPDLKNIFSKLEWFNTEKDSDDIDISNISGINDRDISKAKGKVHYKHFQRWQLANTLTSLYGYDKALQIMQEICKNTPLKELKGDVKTASIHNKPMSSWAIKELNKQHGFKLKINIDNLYKTEIKNIDEKILNNSSDVDPIQILNDNTSKVNLYMRADQYLSDIKDEIISNLSHITLLEAGAGYGKTEMIKSLKSKTLLVLPFTSTIKAKVEADSKTSDWLYYYGNKRPTLEEILDNKNMSMTVDKFSKLNLMELDQANFEYIVIDESHLLFTSSYRDVMTPAIQRIANCKAKVILMTGTPTGEILFFPGIKHIKVTKEDSRKKEFNIHFVKDKDAKLVEIANSMVDDIRQGRHILFPTNQGNLFFEQIKGLVQKRINEIALQNKETPKNINAFYYKKSNYGDEIMESINIDKSIMGNDIIFCTTYLSVGVDICDKYDFCVYFNEPWIAQDIEQFANRLRNNDLYIKMFLEMFTPDGDKIQYNTTKPLDLSFSQADLLLARDLIITCNDMISRNQEESKYNPLISSLLSANKFLKYDENDCKYYIDETTYKLNIFEERYSEYSKQLNVMKNGMKYYGYEIIPTTSNMPDINKEALDDYLKSCRHLRYDWWTQETMNFLNHLNDDNIDIYKELLKGDYAIFKDSEYHETRQENNIYAESIEILEKNIPIILTLYKFYDCDTIREIFIHCIDKKQNKINYAKLERIKKFVIIENNRRKQKIDLPIYKFIVDSQNFAKKNSKVSAMDIKKFIADFTIAYANNISNLVLEDNDILDTLYELLEELWKVIIIQTRPKNGDIFIKPFELLWERKDDITNIYGNITTKMFFEDLIDNLNDKDEENIDIPELSRTQKTKLSDIQFELPNIIHNNYDYAKYSEQDSTNDKFLNKQQSTNRLGNISSKQEQEEDNVIDSPQLNLFD